jgi:hypothetical protein
VPLENQFEQILNGRYLEHEGYGMAANHVDDPAAIAAFLERVPEYQKNLERFEQDGNRLLLSALDEQLDRAAAGLC